MKFQSVSLVALLLFGLGAEGLTLAQTPDPQTGTIVDIQPRQSVGKLKVRQKRGDTPADATVGMPVRRGYLLTLASGAGATVVCADKSKHELETGPQPCPCVADGGIREGSNIPRPRGADTLDSSFPVIISPRGTLLLSGRPTLRWSAVSQTITDSSGTAAEVTYQVSVYTDNMKLVWRKKQIKGINLSYPANEPELPPGDYLLIVSTVSGSSDKEGGPGHGFTVLPKCLPAQNRSREPQCRAQKIRDEEKRIRELHLPDDSTLLLVADLYAANELFAEAIETLEEVLKVAKTPAMVRQLGDLYASVGLNREAEKTYLEALGLPQVASDTEGQALTLHALALTYERLGNVDQARARYAEAISAYEKLHDDITVTELKTQRAKIEEHKK
jgi:hypothetical protein